MIFVLFCLVLYCFIEVVGFLLFFVLFGNFICTKSLTLKVYLLNFD